MPDAVRVHLTVSGRVQGVAFRANTAAVAKTLGVTGWVRNLPDGRVEAVAEGPADAIDRFVAWAHQGPTRARVDELREVRSAATGDFSAFDVRV